MDWSVFPQYWHKLPFQQKQMRYLPKLICTFANAIHTFTNMATTIPYLRWRERINDITPSDYRIGSDLSLIHI